jgi:hypothetical protein
MLTTLLVLSLLSSAPSDAPLAEPVAPAWAPSASVLSPPPLSFGKRHQFALRACAITGASFALVGATELVIYGIVGLVQSLSSLWKVPLLLSGPAGWLFIGLHERGNPTPVRDETMRNVLLGTGIAALVAGGIAGVGCGVISSQ